MKLVAFGWYGGKTSHLNWLLPLLPTEGVQHYCEPFGGSAAVLLNRPAAPVETYNDLDGDLCNFFRVLRDRPEDLQRVLALTPFSREEFFQAIEEQPVDELERARRFFVRARQARTGLAQTASIGRWANCKGASRRGMAGAVSRWWGGIEGLTDIAERLLRVQVENDDALKVIRRYDAPDTLFYCDPPYPHDSRGGYAYAHEMGFDQHAKLAEALHDAQGLVAVSGYDSPTTRLLYGHWNRIVAPAKTAHSIMQPRQEVLWVNWDPESRTSK